MFSKKRLSVILCFVLALMVLVSHAAFADGTLSQEAQMLTQELLTADETETLMRQGQSVQPGNRSLTAPIREEADMTFPSGVPDALLDVRTAEADSALVDELAEAHTQRVSVDESAMLERLQGVINDTIPGVQP